MLKILQHNKYNYALHSPNQRGGVGSHRVCRETYLEGAFTVDRKRPKAPLRKRAWGKSVPQKQLHRTPSPVSAGSPLSNPARVPPAHSCSLRPGCSARYPPETLVSMGCMDDRPPPTERRRSICFPYRLRLSMASRDSRLGSCIHVPSAYRAIQ